MSHYSTFTQRLLATGMLAVLLLSLPSLSHANPCQPPTPSPCGADGVCRPIRPTWGFSQTRWRAWPGESLDQPTRADASADGQEDERQMDRFELPPPEEEDLRGPAKDSKQKDNDPAAEAGGAGGEEAPIEIPEIPDLPGAPAEALPGAEPLPGFDLEGNNGTNGPAPSLEDMPPALPPSLRQVALSLSAPQPLHAPQRFVKQQPTALPLVNPASASVVPPAVEPLQQAIYIESN